MTKQEIKELKSLGFEPVRGTKHNQWKNPIERSDEEARVIMTLSTIKNEYPAIYSEYTRQIGG